MKSSQRINLLFYASFFVFQLPIHASQPLVTLRLSELGVSAAAVGVMIGISGLAPALVAIPGGRLTDRIGSAKQAAFGSLVCMLGFVGMGLVSAPILLVLFTALLGLGQTFGIVAYQSFVASSELIEDRVQAFGWLSAIIAIVQSVGPAGAGLLADWYSLTAVFGASGLIVMFSLLGIPVLRNGDTRGRGGAALLIAQENGSWWRKSSLPFAVVVTLLFALSYNVRLSYLPLYLESIGLSTAQIGIIFSAQALGSLLVRSQIGWLTNLLGQSKTLMLAFATSVPILVLIPLLTGFVSLLSAGFVIGMGNGIMHPVTLAVATVAVPRERQGTALGVRYATFRLGFAISPMLLAVAVALGGIPSAFFFAAALAGAGAIHSWRGAIP